MNKSNYTSKIKINSYSELFGIEDPIKGAATEIKEIPLNQLYEFKGHPFYVRDDSNMTELVESVEKNGVMVPGIVRIRKEGGYEIVAGHRRKRACELAGLSSMPMFVKSLSDDEAVIIMVDSNLYRGNLVPSEKAKAYKMRYDAIKNQGKKGNSLAILRETFGEHEKKIQRYIWLSRLNDELLKMVDDKKISFAQGVDLSFLLQREQKWVLDAIECLDIRISSKQSTLLKIQSIEKKLDENIVWNILKDNNEINVCRRLVLKDKELMNYFDDTYTISDIKEVVMLLLENWKNSNG